MRSRSACLGLFLMACVLPRRLSENIARGKSPAQISDAHYAVSNRAVDGNYNPVFSSGSCTHTTDDDENPWWTVDLRDVYTIHQVVMYNRNKVQSRLDKVSVEGFLVDPFVCTNGVLCAYNSGPSGNVVTMNCSQETKARYVRLRKGSGSALTLCEVEIFGEMTSDQEPTVPLFSPLCSQNRIDKIVGQKLTPSVDLGSVPNPLGCFHLCRRRPSCNIFNYNSVTSACSTSVSLISDDTITFSEDWNLYFFC